MTTIHQHDWELDVAPYDCDEYRRWTRTCASCGDRVTAFAATAVYQHGDDPDRLPHAVSLRTWHLYSACPGKPRAAQLNESPPAYRAERNGESAVAELAAIELDRVVPAILDALRRHGTPWGELAAELGVRPLQLRRWRRGQEPRGFYALRIVQLALTSHDPRAIRPLLRPHAGAHGPLDRGRGRVDDPDKRRPLAMRYAHEADLRRA